MKKSEALQMITKVLKENLDTKYLDVSYEDTADYVLRKLESIGMKPPIRKHCPVLLIDEFQWEKE